MALVTGGPHNMHTKSLEMIIRYHPPTLTKMMAMKQYDWYWKNINNPRCCLHGIYSLKYASLRGKRVKDPRSEDRLRCMIGIPIPITLQWRHNGRDSVSNHEPHDCLLNRLFRRRSKITSKHRVTGLCAGKSPETGKFPAQRASNAENVSIWWRHHEDGEYSTWYQVCTRLDTGRFYSYPLRFLH